MAAASLSAAEAGSDIAAILGGFSEQSALTQQPFRFHRHQGLRTLLPKPASDAASFHDGELLRVLEFDADRLELEPWEGPELVLLEEAAEEDGVAVAGAIGNQEADLRHHEEIDRMEEMREEARRLAAIQRANEEEYLQAVEARLQFRNMAARSLACSSQRLVDRLVPMFDALESRTAATLSELDTRRPPDRDLLPLMQIPASQIATIGVTAVVNACLSRFSKRLSDLDDKTLHRRAVRVKSLVQAIGDELHLEACRAALQDKIGKKGVDALLRQDASLSHPGSQNPSVYRRIQIKNGIRDNDVDPSDSLKWSTAQRVKIGALVLSNLLDVAESSLSRSEENSAETLPDVYYDRKSSKGIIFSDNFEKLLTSDVSISEEGLRVLGVADLESVDLRGVDERSIPMRPKHFPMVVKPARWQHTQWRRGAASGGQPAQPAPPAPASSDPFRLESWNGGYAMAKIPLVRLPERATRAHKEAIQRGHMPDVISGLDNLSSVPWRINKFVYDTVRQAEQRKLQIAELPGFEDVPTPEVDEALQGKDLRDALLLRSRTQQHNRNLHSLRCTYRLKLGVAERMLEYGVPFYFPHNMDFRGRVYPVPPHLNYMSDDLCRGLLMFAEGKRLGPKGLFWLKVHLANLVGKNKISLQERAAWVDSVMPTVEMAAQDPLAEGPHRDLWTTADEPWQALAICRELAQATRHEAGPEEYVCHVPVHQDGTCNGLQHYAALGRDEDGAKAVNLTPEDRPQDVYSDVCAEVKRLISKIASMSDDSLEALKKAGPQAGDDAGDAGDGADATVGGMDPGRQVYLARLVLPHLERKVVKQTVMTSVYGVTFIGARDQIKNRLAERLFQEGSGILSNAESKDLKDAAKFLALMTMSALRNLFKSAREIMDWLAEASTLCARENGQPMSWVTPLGFPVSQPYRNDHIYRVQTCLNRVTLVENSDAVPVKGAKQRTAFPPNFVHSLDSTHMLMTCKAMCDQGLTFCAVHDSYWTHAADVDAMNTLLRQKFVELYSQPILEELRESLSRRHAKLDFPALPERGDLDIKVVEESTYFFS